MINVADYEILQNNTTTMKRASFDDANREYMTECNERVINFDKVVKNYCRNIHVSSVDSNDALVARIDGDVLTFIEFKNGYINKDTQKKLLKKIYDSILIFSDIVGENISSIRQFLNYILVYNEEKNDNNPKTNYCESQSRDEIDKILLGYGREKHIKYGLEFLKGYCFKEVDTYAKDEFEELFVKAREKQLL